MGNGYKKLETYEELVWAMSEVIPQNLTCNDVEFVCIGTDRSTGDSLAPLVGTFLQSMGYTNINGTIDDPVHAVNLQERLSLLPPDKKVVAMDACLGSLDSVGTFTVFEGALKPGAGVKKVLPPVGDYSIYGVVNVGGFLENFVLQSTRLSLVMNMAQTIAKAINHVLPPIPSSQEVSMDVHDTYMEIA